MEIERSEPNNDEYPPRLYAPGKSPFLKRSISHHSHLSDLVELQDAIGPNVFNDIMNNSQVGVMLKLAVGKYNWCGKVVHYFITHQLAVSKPYEFWSLIAGRPVRFSLYEFEAITGLNCDPIDPDDSFEGDHTELWGQLNVKPYQGPSWQEIHDVLDKCRQWDYATRRKVGLLYVLIVGIYGLHRNSRLPLNYAKRVIDAEAFERVPWGRLSYKELILSIKSLSLKGTSMSIHGCVHAMQIWAYMVVPILGEEIGRLDEQIYAGVPLLRWKGGRTRSAIETIIQKDKSKNNKPRVNHILVVKSLDKIYPAFPDVKEEGVDQKLHNMIRDIIENRLDETRWDISSNKTKRKTREKEVEPQKRKMKRKVDTSLQAQPEERSGVDTILLAAIEKMSAQMARMEDDWRADRLRITKLEEGRANVGEEAGTKHASTKHGSSGTGGEEAEVSKPVEKAASDASWLEMFGTAPPKKQSTEKTPPPKSVPPLAYVDISDISGQETTPRKKQQPILRDSSGDSLKQNLDLVLAKYSSAEKPKRRLNDGTHVLKERVRYPPSSQVSPFIGCSVVRRMLKKSYDPFEPVEPVREMHLMNYIEEDLINHPDKLDRNVELYMRLMTPKEDWKEEEFGWLDTQHMALGMSFFTERDRQDPSPYRPRIAFINPYFTGMWATDFQNDFLPNEKAWIFTDGYIKLYNGGNMTNKKWVEDVDTLYICHNINGRHWIALEVDIPKRRITVYDSICSAYDDTVVSMQCRPYARFIPLLIKHLSPGLAKQKKKMSVAAFTVYRKKQIPQNVQSGDCGVYTLKYIECLALGRDFDGLSDATVGDIRRKYAADFFAEKATDGISFSDPNPRVAEGSKDAMISGSQPV